MKANFYLIGLSIILLPGTYFLNNSQHHWFELVPLSYLAYALVVGTISAYRNRK